MGANYDNTSRHPYRPLADCDSMGRHVGPLPTRARIRRRHGGGAAAPRRPALAAPALGPPAERLGLTRPGRPAAVDALVHRARALGGHRDRRPDRAYVAASVPAARPRP